MGKDAKDARPGLHHLGPGEPPAPCSPPAQGSSAAPSLPLDPLFLAGCDCPLWLHTVSEPQGKVHPGITFYLPEKLLTTCLIGDLIHCCWGDRSLRERESKRVLHCTEFPRGHSHSPGDTLCNGLYLFSSSRYFFIQWI